MSPSRNRYSEKSAQGKDAPHSEVLWGDYTPLQAHFLNRLKELLALKERRYKGPPSEEWLTKAVDWAIYSSFRDCDAQGVIEKAKVLLKREHKAN